MRFDRKLLIHAFLMIQAGAILITQIGCNRGLDDGLQFVEVSQSQPITIEDFSDLRFTDQDGNEIELAEIMTREYLVLVVTRGWYGGVCVYSASQPSRLARRIEENEAYEAQVGGVVAGGEGDIPNEDIPYPILLDINLASVDQLGIREELAKPSTYCVDRQGRVVFAYVGDSIADRPTVDSVLQQLSQLKK